MTEPSYTPSEAEVSAAVEAAINFMLADKSEDMPAVVTAVHLVRAVLTAAAQVRESAKHARFVEEHLYEQGIGSSDELGKCFPDADGGKE